MLDINLLRAEKGGDPERVRESQRRRFASVELVDEVIHLDKEWRRCQFELKNFQTDKNKLTKEIGLKMRNKEDATELKSAQEELEQRIKDKEKEVVETKCTVEAKLMLIGNLVHDSVPVDNNEDNNLVVRTFGDPRKEDGLKNHVELVRMLKIADIPRGTEVAGGRGYYLKGDGVALNQALICFGMAFLRKRGYTELQTPFFMTKDVMAECAQLSQFDEELYKITGDGDDKYLIATSEQPLCAYHRAEWMAVNDLPKRYAGYSTCFRKEAGAHGRDTLGIFRVHQFEKIEQFCITSPLENKSWEMHEEMLKNSEDFYKELGIPYRVVSIVSGALNDAAAKKYDLEGWFPAAQAYRELVSCSNCTDFQSRKLKIRYGQTKKDDKAVDYVHLLNSTLTATERTMCAILENYQTKEGVRVPPVLQPFMLGVDFIPFKAAVTTTVAKKVTTKKVAVPTNDFKNVGAACKVGREMRIMSCYFSLSSFSRPLVGPKVFACIPQAGLVGAL